MDSTEPQHARSTILSTFLRGRPRNSSQSHIVLPDDPSFPPANQNNQNQNQPPSPNGNGRRRPPGLGGGPGGGGASPVQQSQSMGLTGMLRRRRSAGQIPPHTQPTAPPVAASATTPSSPSGTHRIRLVPHLDSRRSLKFDPISRDLREGDPPLRIGRFTDRSGLGLSAINALGSNKLAFKSKVVSRAHAEIWVDTAGKFFIRDTKSSSGTFLNHSRLSPANTESRPFGIKDGDVLQLGVDYQGGTEDIYKSVKIRIEIGREWQMQANAFNTNALKTLKTLTTNLSPATKPGKPKSSLLGLPDCCICLFPLTIHQSLFISPCSHTFHYKCIRPLVENHYPAFSCPLCRAFANLDEDVEVDIDPLSLGLNTPSGEGPGWESEVGEGGTGIRGHETEVEGETTPIPPPISAAQGEEMDIVEEEDHPHDASMDEDVEIIDRPDSGEGLFSDEGEDPDVDVDVEDPMGQFGVSASPSQGAMIQGDGTMVSGSKRKR